MRAVVLFVLCCSALFVASFEVEKASGYTLLKTSNASALYRVETKFYADAPIEMIVLKGSRWQIGYDYGKILGREIVNNYAHFFQNVFKKLVKQIVFVTFIFSGKKKALCSFWNMNGTITCPNNSQPNFWKNWMVSIGMFYCLLKQRAHQRCGRCRISWCCHFIEANVDTCKFSRFVPCN